MDTRFCRGGNVKIGEGVPFNQTLQAGSMKLIYNLRVSRVLPLRHFSYIVPTGTKISTQNSVLMACPNYLLTCHQWYAFIIEVVVSIAKK